MTKLFTKEKYEESLTELKVSKEARACIDKIIEFDKKYPKALLPEMLDFVDVVEFGAKKHGMNSYLTPNNKSMKHATNHDSLFHHIAKSFTATADVLDASRYDNESALDHLLHAQCRAAMEYVRIRLGIKHPDNEKLADDDN